MTAAASAVSVPASGQADLRRPTRGYAQIPNSVIENQALCTPAELHLILCIVRRGAAAGDAVTLSDQNWVSWTGLTARSKEIAMRGLASKGLEVSGRGDGARFRFNSHTWENYVRSSPRVLASKPRSAGRAVTATPGMKVHADCKQSGCRMLDTCETGCAKPPQLTETIGPVSRPQGSAQAATTAAAAPRTWTGGTGDAAKPVSRTSGQLFESAWVKTLLVLRAIFPAIGLVFLGRLLGIVRRAYPAVTDEQLAQAASRAIERCRRRITSEGLLFYTVPEELDAILRPPGGKKPPGAEKGGRPEATSQSEQRGGVSPGGAPPMTTAAEQARVQLERLAARLYELGAPFDQYAGGVAELARRTFALADPAADVGALIELDADFGRLVERLRDAASRHTPFLALADAERRAWRYCGATAESSWRAASDVQRQAALGRAALEWLGVYTELLIGGAA